MQPELFCRAFYPFGFVGWGKASRNRTDVAGVGWLGTRVRECQYELELLSTVWEICMGNSASKFPQAEQRAEKAPSWYVYKRGP